MPSESFRPISRSNKKKIINDPIYGFITIPGDLIFDIIEHPYFQRLRRIKQLGLADFTYPGALHTRFHHALGAMHLMGMALDNLKSKGHAISDEELEAAQVGVLLHDIGHGPFSHALEPTLLKDVHHEQLSVMGINFFNKMMDGRLNLALSMFQGTHPRKFFNQLISSQLDIDRLDYLQRDCFFTGVSEGTIGADRIIKMLDIHNDELVVEEKGIYSIENFLNARRLMYWQVYLHKIVLSAEKMIVQIIRRARTILNNGGKLDSTPALMVFLKEEVSYLKFVQNPDYLQAFMQLDDYDLWGAIKLWCNHEDKVLALLANSLLNRHLFKVTLSTTPFDPAQLQLLGELIIKKLQISYDEMTYFLVSGEISNSGYQSDSQTINILTKDGRCIDIAQASDLPNIKAISKILKKYYICWPKDLYL